MQRRRRNSSGASNQEKKPKQTAQCSNVLPSCSSSRPGQNDSKNQVTFKAVDSVLGRRKNYQNEVEYLLKWSCGDHFSWETANHVTEDLIRDFERNRNLAMLNNLAFRTKEIIVFKDYLEELRDVRKHEDGSIEFLVRWRDPTEEPTWISSALLRETHPQLVIAFYEKITRIID